MNMRSQRVLMDRITEDDGFNAAETILSCVLADNELLKECTLEPEDFEEELHQIVFREASRLIHAGHGASAIALKPSVPKELVGVKFTPAQYLVNLAVNGTNPETKARFDVSVETVKAVSLARAMVKEGAHLTEIGREGHNALTLLEEYELLEARFKERLARLHGLKSVGVSGNHAFTAAIAQAESAMQGSDDAGIDCGLEPVRQLIGRLMPGHLIVIGGATKQGKSALARQLAMGAMRNGAAVLDYSGEMDSEELARRELARISKVSATQQMSGQLSAEELRQVRQAQVELSRMEWRIIDQRRTVEQLCREAESFAKRHPRMVLIVDSVTLFEHDRETRRMEKFQFAEYTTDRLKALARKTRCTVIALSQLKKNTFVVERQYNKAPTVKTYRNVVARRPKASDLYGSCERDADHVIIPFNPMPILEDIEPAEGSDEHILWEEVVREYKGHAEIILAISRHRPPSRRNVQWVGEITSFLPVARQGYDQQRMF